MKESITTYCEFMIPGAFMSEHETQKVNDRDISNIIIPKYCFAFRFYDVVETVTQSGETLRGSPKNYSGMFYPEPVYLPTKAEVDSMDGANGLKSYMNDGIQVIKTRCDNWQTFEKGDKIVRVMVKDE